MKYPLVLLLCLGACANTSSPTGGSPPGNKPFVPDDLAIPGAADLGVATDLGPQAATPPPIPAYSGGACPTLAAGTDINSPLNELQSSGETRSFRLLVPSNYDGTAWPVMFAWHWLGSSATSVIRDAQLDTAAAQMKFIAIIPEHIRNASGNKVYTFEWPFAETWGADKELVFFDDMLSCVSRQYMIDPARIHGMGASAGGLWLTYLSTTDRAKYLASNVVISGGLGKDPTGLWNMMYQPQPNKFSSLIVWGGQFDFLGVDFNQASIRYRDSLKGDNHFVATCTHTAGHGLPPVDQPTDGTTRYKAFWQFLLDHPYGTTPSTSPYKTGLPANAGWPSWCTIP